MPRGCAAWCADTGYGVIAGLERAEDNWMLERVYDGVPDGQCVSSNQNLPEGVSVYIYVCLSRNAQHTECITSDYGLT
jgi:hypothetical protein